VDDKFLPKSQGDQQPVPFSYQRRDELCRRLNDFYSTSGIKPSISPSEIFLGALYMMRHEHMRDNPDWMAQVAHSLREILYPFEKKKYGINRSEAFSRFGSTYDKQKRDKDVGAYFNLIRDIAHHNLRDAGKYPLIGGSNDMPVEITRPIFEEIFFQFSNILFEVLRRQDGAHREIEALLSRKNISRVININNARNLSILNSDARDYFFFKADEHWLDWLWENGFLDPIKEKSENLTRYSYTMPELEYLGKVVEKKPKGVADIILSTPISKETFNPEVLDRFLRIIERLPTKEIIRIIPKIHDENWVRLMGVFNRWGFEYKKIFDILAGAKDYTSILTLSKSILSIRTEEERKKADTGIGADNPFYFDDLSDTEVLENTLNLDSVHSEAALKLTTEALGKIAAFGKHDKQDGIFTLGEHYFLFDVDFFTLRLGDKEHISSSRDNIQELAAVVVSLLRKLLENNCDEKDAVRHIYKTYICSLPDTRAMWRLRLFALSLCPHIFKAEIHTELFRIFASSDANDLGIENEYQQLMRVGFPVLDVSDRLEYIQRAVESLTEERPRHIGNQIFSYAIPTLTPDEKSLIEKTFGPLNAEYVPEASGFGRGFAGTIVSRSPGDDEEWRGSVSDIVEKLKGDWSPSTLAENNRGREYENEEAFLHPIDAEGAGDRIKGEMKKRAAEYINQAELFFNREHLHPHYTYKFLQGVHDLLREKADLSGADLSHVFNLIQMIIDSGKKTPFEKKSEDTGITWTANWGSVHRVVTDVLKDLLSENDKERQIDFKENRALLFSFIQYLLEQPDPSVASETSEYSPERKEYTGSDPYTVAINSVRGEAFIAFTYFLYRDGESLKDSGKKIQEDSKELFEKILAAEKTQAIMFLFGHNLASFYFRDTTWIRGLLSDIFLSDPLKKDLYLSAWEGYLANNIYKEMFFDPLFQDLYRRNIQTSPEEYTKRRYFRDINEGLATHFALAFVHFKEFKLGDNLLKLFWETKNTNRHKEFISFIGRYCISKDGDSAFSDGHPLDIEKLKEFWEWALEHCESEALDGFGFWVNPNKDFFSDDKWLAKMFGETLKKSKGGLDWEHGLMERLPFMVNSAPDETLTILQEYLLGERNEERQWFRVDENFSKVFRVLSENPSTHDGIAILVNNLISQYGRRFWELKDALVPKK
jgi:hypothetical protein